MDTFLEDYDNPIMQVFSEFVTFLYVVEHDCKSNKMLHNIMLESKKIHIRALCEFFSNKRNNDDDYIYTDFISCDADLVVSIPTKLKHFINKSTAHISKRRGKQEVPENEFIQIQKNLLKAINNFMGEIDKNINSEYKRYLDDAKVQELRTAIFTAIIRIVTRNTLQGVEIDLCN